MLRFIPLFFRRFRFFIAFDRILMPQGYIFIIVMFNYNKFSF